jgi:hypothetical protein
MPGPRQRFVTSVFAIAILAFGSYAFGNPTTQSQRRSRQSKPEETPVKKGKKGLAGNSKKPESSNSTSKPSSKPSSNTTAAAAKPAPVTTTVAPPLPTQPAPEQQAPTPPVAVTTTAGQIDVIERRTASKSPAAASGNVKSSVGVYGISNRRMDVEIEAHRVIQIQKALKERGFYSSEPSGIYDDETFEGMKAFQAKERIDVTGYPTAHALKRLGL